VNIDYVNKKEYPDLMDFADLRNWLEKEIAENDIVEIAGTGEPTLCDWLPDLLRYLEQKKAWTVLRTNGFKLDGWRMNLSKVLVILAKHDSINEYMLDKCQYLTTHDLILTSIEETRQVSNDVASKLIRWLPCRIHDVERAFFVTPDGKVRFMPCLPHEQGTVWDYKPQRWNCITFDKCSFVLNAYNLIEYLKTPFELPSECNYERVGTWQNKFRSYVYNSISFEGNGH